MHRDIKPENVVFDSDFNAKLCDFGWTASLQQKELRNSVCGTFEYMSPEVVYQKSHNSKIDIWALGILLYEMLHGLPPFKAKSMQDIKRELDIKNIMIKKSISKETKSLLKSMLKARPEKRCSIEYILKHKAFKRVKN